MTMSDAEFVQHLACPRCGAALRATTNALQCSACDTRYPRLGEVPFLFAEPDVALGEWRQRYQHVRAKHDAELATLDAALADNPASTTAARLKLLADGTRRQRDALQTLLQPLMAGDPVATRATYLALRTRLPPDQGLNTYVPNIHRDWAWGDTENQGSIEMLQTVLGNTKPQRVLVLGAGAGRLTHDLNVALAPELCVGLDFNPLLMLLAARLGAGDTLEMVEFPLAPRQLTDSAVVRKLSADTSPATPTQWVLGDALRAPFAQGSFDLVVTPWLLDIVSEPPAAFAPRINALLAANGSWLNFGSVAFRGADPVENIGVEELIEACVSAGFTEGATIEQELPYLKSPASRHSRVETLVAQRYDKSKDVKPNARWRALPDWIVVGKTPVPASEAFLQQAAATRIHAFIMALIDGKRSLEEMAAIMEQQNLMPAADAIVAIRGFLIKMHDDARRYSGL